ncbi:MAG: hypothetical protein BWZ10_00788 [candidate division BRC1 bacterium ADurb.BinA364]|nr:MAG: hypothetical protein BWZ10_00788 [candidate division BRC1 bacterium ADurb.BinA364]
MIASTFRLRVPAGLLREGGYSPGAIGAALRAFEQAREFPAAKPFRPGKPARTIDLKKCVMKIGEPRHEAAGMELDLTLSQQEGNYLEPIACLNAMLGAQWSFALGIDAARIETRLKE